MSYQIVVISVSKERREYLERQFQKLNIKDKNIRIHYIRAATIENSQDYLPNNTNINLNFSVLCCARSHLFCLEYACLSSSPEFTLILEDDVVLHKTQFFNVIEEIIERWDEVIVPRKIVSLGWVPVETPEWYDKLRIFHTLKCLNGSGITYIINPGLQAYLVRKKDIRPILSTLLYSTYQELDIYIEKYKKEHNDKYMNSRTIDYYLNVILGQAVVYPPIAIEKDFSSTLNHNNWNNYWSRFFKNREKRLDDFLLTERDIE